MRKSKRGRVSRESLLGWSVAIIMLVLARILNNSEMNLGAAYAQSAFIMAVGLGIFAIARNLSNRNFQLLGYTMAALIGTAGLAFGIYGWFLIANYSMETSLPVVVQYAKTINPSLYSTIAIIILIAYNVQVYLKPKESDTSTATQRELDTTRLDDDYYENGSEVEESLSAEQSRLIK